jgi:hypothetical protein
MVAVDNGIREGFAQSYFKLKFASVLISEFRNKLDELVYE